ncbi:MAG: prepilin peptidase [Thermodesulfobacteriota bacterium]
MIPQQLVPHFPWLAGIVGLILGSFYTVCVHRYLTGESIVFPGSHCPHCKRRLRFWENIPLLSFIILGGRCRGCKKAIAWRYPLMEALSLAWAVVLALRFGPTLPWLALMAVGGIFLVASFIDLEIFILPDILTYPGIVLGICTGIFALKLTPAQSLIGAAAGAGLFWLLRFVHMRTRGVEGLGLGDVKLMAMIGGLTGWMGLPPAILFGAASALVLSPVFRMASKDEGPLRIPFGPFLCLGCALALLWGDKFMLLLAGRL